MKISLCLAAGCLLFSYMGFSQQANTLTSKEKKKGWVLLFDGTTTNGWTTESGKPVPAGWRVHDGMITAEKGGHGGDIITTGEYSDFDFSADFNIEPGTNSGIKIFFTKYEKGGWLGMEYQIIDDTSAEDIHQPNHLTGSFYDVLSPDAARKKLNPPGQWNTVRIRSRGRKVEHWLNGLKILEYTRGSRTYLDSVARSKFAKTVPAFGMVAEGHILLQEHGGGASFRNIRIRKL